MAKLYYTLVLRDGGHPWRPEFGDYDKALVLFELAEYTAYDYLPRNAKVIATGDTDAEIAAAVAALNQK